MSRIRANQITNQAADGAPTVQHGLIIAGVSTFTGSVSIGGTLTYEDVTNIDSVGIVTARAGIFVPDSQTIHIGNAAGNGDLQLSHNGSASYIKDAGTGSLVLETNELVIQNAGGSRNLIYSLDTGKTSLYFNGGQKLETTNTGVTVTGTAVATTFSGSGASLTSLNGSNIASGTVPVARIGTGTKNTSTFYRGDGTFATVTAPAITTINNASNDRIVTSEGGTTVNSEATLSYNGSTLTINPANDAKLSLTCPSSDGDDWNYINFVGSNGTRDSFFGTWSDGRPVWSRDDGSKRIFIESDGATLNGHFYPEGNNSYDLGKNTARWRHVYTGDLHLSNEGIAQNDGSGNSVDGTWGDYTMQEGENDLFLINNRNGKKYKFNLTEVS